MEQIKAAGIKKPSRQYIYLLLASTKGGMPALLGVYSSLKRARKCRDLAANEFPIPITYIETHVLNQSKFSFDESLPDEIPGKRATTSHYPYEKSAKLEAVEFNGIPYLGDSHGTN